MLETAEEKAAKEARTRGLLAAYKSKTGLKIDPKLKSECQEVCYEFVLTCILELKLKVFSDEEL